MINPRQVWWDEFLSLTDFSFEATENFLDLT